MEQLPKEFSQTYFLTPAECNPQQRMPLTLLINRLIEVATLAANRIGTGWAYLKQFHQTWVLSRVAVEMRRYPGVNDNYTITTWISAINRLFTERDFEITDGSGEIIGYARTVWAVLDTRTRSACDISGMMWVSELVPDRICPVEKPGRLLPVKEYTSTEYRFTYCDLDFNRHVNSSRYIELLLNQWSLDFHDSNRLTRFEIAYLKEAYYDQEVSVRLSQAPNALSPTRAELVSEGVSLCRASLTFSPR